MTIRDGLNLHDDAVILLAHILKKSKAWLYANQDSKLTNKQFNRLKELIRKRETHWPAAYLTGHKEFFGLDFKITPDVLVPRPETELLVELALAKLATSPFFPPQVRPRRRGWPAAGRGRTVIDIGTGSGNIIISIAKKLLGYHRLVYDTTHFYGIDSSKKALALAKANAKKHGVLKKIRFLHGNLLSYFSPMRRGRLRGGSLIIANLPYLTTKQLKQPTIKHEPKAALHGGRDGLKYFRNLFKQISTLSEVEGLPYAILLEHDPAQKTKLQNLAQKHFPKAKVRFHKDLTHRWRLLEIKI